MMKKPRCGVPDKHTKRFHIAFTKSGRKKRDAVVTNKLKSNKTEFYFYITSHLNKKINYRSAYLAFEYAFNMWAAVTPLIFIRGDKHKYQDIEIAFKKGKYDFICFYFQLFHF